MDTDDQAALVAAGSHLGQLTIVKLTIWVCGTDLLTFGRERARGRQMSEPRSSETEVAVFCPLLRSRGAPSYVP